MPDASMCSQGVTRCRWLADGHIFTSLSITPWPLVSRSTSSLFFTVVGRICRLHFSRLPNISSLSQVGIHRGQSHLSVAFDALKFVLQSDFRTGAAGVSGLTLQRPAVRRVAPVAARAEADAAAIAAGDPEGKTGFLGIPTITWKKIVPLGFMFFCILFNYTILRDTKVMVDWQTAPPYLRYGLSLKTRNRNR